MPFLFYSKHCTIGCLKIFPFLFKANTCDYCDVAWSSIGKIERDKLDRAQRRAAKIVLKTKDSDPKKNLKWLPLSMRRDIHTINLTFKCLKGSPPMFFKDYFKVFRTVHNTRGSGHNLLLPKVRTETARKSFYFNGSKLFNNSGALAREARLRSTMGK